MPHSTPEMILEDIVICQDCMKNDVCLILRGIAEAHMQYQQVIENIKNQYTITTETITSIEECKHKVLSTIGIIER